MTMTTSSTGGYRTRMKLTLDANPAVNLIRSYSIAEVHVGDRILHRSCIISPDAVIADWRPASVEDLQESDLDALLAMKPELVLLGTGATHRFAPPAIRLAFAKHRVALETMDLGAACRTFNVLVQEGRRATAALLF
jgi:uncharacterized protein